ncbi:MAG: anti-sigma factor family protein [Acetobacteraceae bacterium]
MPTCRDVSELVTDYLERALPLRRRIGVFLHLRQCEACRRYLDQMRKTIRFLSSHPPPPPPPDVEQTVLTRVRRTDPPAGPPS